MKKCNLALSILTTIFFAISADLAKGITPEVIGGTQYATGHFNSTSLEVLGLRDRFAPDLIVPDSMVKKLQSLLLTTSYEEMKALMQTIDLASEEKKIIIKAAALMQDKAKSKGATVLMIGDNSAVAVDGHHRLRAQGKLYEVMKGAEELWNPEAKAVLEPLGRVDASGKIKLSLDLDPAKLKIIERLPANISSEELMRKLLEHNKGVWKDPKLNDLGKKFFGQAAKDAPIDTLKLLAHGLGMSDGPGGVVKYTPIRSLQDDVVRSFLGSHFFTRGISVPPVNFVDYVEFYIGDDMKKIVRAHPERYPSLAKIVAGENMTSEMLESLIKAGSSEMDELLTRSPELSQKLLNYSTESRNLLAAQLDTLQFKVCTGARSSRVLTCGEFLKRLSAADREFLEALSKLSPSEIAKISNDLDKAGHLSAKGCSIP